MTTSQIPLSVRPRVRRRHNRRVVFILIRRRVDTALNDFFWAHAGVVTVTVIVFAGLIITVAARVLLSLGGI